MQELRCLFALMVGSTRRFVDPSAAVELLREAFRTNEAQQVQNGFEVCCFGKSQLHFQTIKAPCSH